MEEIWKDIPGYEGFYQASNAGRIRSKRKVMALRRAPNGYLIITLCKNGDRKYFLVHRVIALTFIPNPKRYPVVNHKDEDITNNSVSNLEWCTQKYNVNYGTGRARLAAKQSKPIEQLLDGKVVRRWENSTQLREAGYHRWHVSDCCHGKQATYRGYEWRFATKVN